MVSEVIKKANWNRPEKITAVTNCHRLSTYYSALELSPQVQEAWFKHMGHAKRISENVPTWHNGGDSSRKDTPFNRQWTL